MSRRGRVGLVLAGVFVVACVVDSTYVPVFAQSTREPQKAAGARSALRTADGHPDLSGVWSFASGIPLQRPEEFGDKGSSARRKPPKSNGAPHGKAPPNASRHPATPVRTTCSGRMRERSGTTGGHPSSPIRRTESFRR